MSDLTEAIAAEALGDFAKALDNYSRLTESGSPLDRVGIFQADERRDRPIAPFETRR